MPSLRDPLSVRYDVTVRRVLVAAIRARQQRQPARTFLASPPREFRKLDRGGRTPHERAFTRAVYYQVIKEPLNAGRPVIWSAKIVWGRIEKRGGRWGRQVAVRLYLARSGSKHAAKLPGSKRWSIAGQVAPLQSLPGQRIDS